MCVCVHAHVRALSRVLFFATPWTAAGQVSLSMGFSRQEYWSGLPFPTPRDLPNPGIQPMSLAPPALAGRFFTTALPGKPQSFIHSPIKYTHGKLCLKASSLTTIRKHKVMGKSLDAGVRQTQVHNPAPPPTGSTLQVQRCWAGSETFFCLPSWFYRMGMIQPTLQVRK